MSKFLEQLKKAASMAVQKKVVEHNGVEIEFYMTPLTIGERQRAQKQAKSDDPTEYALYLLCQKARDENGQKLLNPGSPAELKNEYPSELIDKLLLEMINNENDEGVEDEDPKAYARASRKTAS
jgi:hypothetical protein